LLCGKAAKEAYETALYLPTHPTEFHTHQLYVCTLNMGYVTPEAALHNERTSLKPAYCMFTHVVMHTTSDGKQAFYFYATSELFTKKPESVRPHILGRKAVTPIVIAGVEIPLPSSRPKKMISLITRPCGSAVLVKRWATKMSTWLVLIGDCNDGGIERGIPQSVITNPTAEETSRMCTINVPRDKDENINSLLMELAEELSRRGCRCLIRSATIRVMLANVPNAESRFEFTSFCRAFLGRQVSFWFDVAPTLTAAERAAETTRRTAARNTQLEAGHHAVLASTNAEEQIDIPLIVALSKSLKFSFASYDKVEGTSNLVKFASAADMEAALAIASRRELGPFSLTPWRPQV
jgi:hypothetical protein